jgi:hypothetical protein
VNSRDKRPKPRIVRPGTLLLVAERNGPEMLARIAVMKVLNRDGAGATQCRDGNRPRLFGLFVDQQPQPIAITAPGNRAESVFDCVLGEPVAVQAAVFFPQPLCCKIPKTAACA